MKKILVKLFYCVFKIRNSESTGHLINILKAYFNLALTHQLIALRYTSYYAPQFNNNSHIHKLSISQTPFTTHQSQFNYTIELSHNQYNQH